MRQISEGNFVNTMVTIHVVFTCLSVADAAHGHVRADLVQVCSEGTWDMNKVSV